LNVHMLQGLNVDTENYEISRRNYEANELTYQSSKSIGPFSDGTWGRK